MSNYFLLAVSMTVMLVGCSGSSVPKVADAHHIVIDGVEIKQMEFLKNYCEGKTADETCTKVQRAMIQDSTKGDAPRF